MPPEKIFPAEVVFVIHNKSFVMLVEIDLVLPSRTALEVSLAHNVG